MPTMGSNDSNDSLASKQNWAKELVWWVHTQDQVNLVKKVKTRCYIQAIPLVEFRAFLTRWLVQHPRAKKDCL